MSSACLALLEVVIAPNWGVSPQTDREGDTRADLTAARRLYARLGYDEVEAFNTGPYAEHWFAKDLPPLEDRPGHLEQPPR